MRRRIIGLTEGAAVLLHLEDGPRAGRRLVAHHLQAVR